jgi:hypothetical protein
MAATIRGDAILKWGTYTLSGYIVADEEVESSTESFQIEDEIGDVVTDITTFGEKTSATFNFVPLSATTPPAPGAILVGPNSLRVIVRSLRRIRSRKMPEMWRITGEAYPEITLV